MKAVILVAGRGKRLTPLTNFIALLPIKGRPVIENLKASGTADMLVVIGHLGKQVVGYLGDGSRYGVKISYIKQKKRLGTAHALELAASAVSGDFVACASDAIFPAEHIRALQNFHFQHGCDATLSLKILDRKAIRESSVVVLEEDNSVSRIIEKPLQEANQE